MALANRWAAAVATALPGSVLPVNAIFSTRGCVASAAPAVAPSPGMTLSTPGGMPASLAMSASSSAVSGVRSDGLSTTVFPVASAGAVDLDEVLPGRRVEDVDGRAVTGDHASADPQAGRRPGQLVAGHEPPPYTRPVRCI